MENKDIKKMIGLLLVLGGTYTVYKNWNEKKPTEKELTETSGQLSNKTLGYVALIGGGLLFLSK
jgi:hypothetical protein